MKMRTQWNSQTRVLVAVVKMIILKTITCIMKTSFIQQDMEDALEAQTACTARCCSSDEKGFQPVDKPTLDMIATQKGTFSLSGTSGSLG